MPASFKSIGRSSDERKAPRIDRGRVYLGRLRDTPPYILRVCVVDMVDDARAILADYRRDVNALWSRFDAGNEEQPTFVHTPVEVYRGAVPTVGFLMT